jgi:hypothetical protein
MAMIMAQTMTSAISHQYFVISVICPAVSAYPQ